MDFGVSELLQELKKLRQGYGIESRTLPSDIGPALRAVCRVSPEDSAGAVRRKVRETLNELADQLNETQRSVVRTALALDGTGGRWTERQQVLAGRLDRDGRTVRRRTDDVLARLAELGVELEQSTARPGGRPGTPWHTVSLETVVRLDQPVMEVWETRRIAVHQDGLDEIDLSVTVSTTQAWDGATEPRIDLVRGGQLAPPHQLGANRMGIRLRPARPLARGDRHEFILRTIVKSDVEPHYVCTPKYPCDRFDLTVRFAPDRLPRRIWLLDSVFALELADPLQEREPLVPDRAGEVHAEFVHLATNLCYGIGWRP